jgi:hypothetical protein
MELTRIARLAPREYEHPFDRKALDALENTRGVETLVRKFNELGIERAARIIYTGSNLKVTPSSLPEVHEVLEACCDTLDLPDLPELYLRRMDAIQGATVGVNRPLVVLSTEAVELLTTAELRFVVGREVGHIKSQHTLYHQIGVLLPVLSEVLAAPTLGLGSLLTAGIQMALVHWVRMSEFTADRAGLLACQDVEAATRALAKIAGLPPRYYDSFSLDDFVTQAREFEGLDGTYDRVLKFLVREEHLWTIARAHEFLAWTDAGGYRDVLERKTEQKPLAMPLQVVAFCTQCGARAEGPGAFCSACGVRLAAL